MCMMKNRPHFSLKVSRHRLENILSCLLLFIASFHVDASSSGEKKTFLKTKCEDALPECECDNYEDIVELACHNISNFETFSWTLSNGSVFEVNTTFWIFLSGARVLHRRFLKGLALYRLYINDTETEIVEDGAFDGMLQLRRFSVWRSSIKEIPDFRSIQNSLRNLKLENSYLTSVEGDNLKNLSILQTLSFAHNSISYVVADAFQGTENLLIFDMSDNLLQSLPPNLFDPWKKLKKVSLSKNHLLHVNQLFAVTHPQFIYLDHNNLTDLDSVLHPNMSIVEMIQLSNNPISKVTVNSFNGKLNRARSLYLDHCQIKEFDVKHYASLKSLSSLDLSYNLIEKVDNQIISFGKNVELDFTGNKIKEFNAMLSYSVRVVYLNKNLMTTVRRAVRFSQMSKVLLADNRIQSLEYEDFHGLHGIVLLDLQGNLISSIECETFSSIRKELIYLDLSRNKIRRLNGCVQSLSLLESLNLTDNQIEVLEPNEFKGLNELVELYLQGNRIETLGLEVQGLNRLKHLVVSHNRIRIIKGDQLPTSLQYVYVDGNPLQCDCQIWSFLQHLNSTENLKTDVQPCIPFNNTSAMDSTRCPEGCQCFCKSNAGDHYISVDCSGIGLTELPSIFSSANMSKLEGHDFSSMTVFLPRNIRDTAPFAIQDKIGGLDFSHNNLRSLENVHLPKETKSFFLDHNLLSRPDISLFYSLEGLGKVTLSGNPWTCDCETVAFKRWILSHSEIIADVNETRCDPGDQDSSGLFNQVIWILQDADICSVGIKTNILIFLGVLSFFLTIIVMMILWTLYEIDIKVWLHARGVIFFKERDTDQGKVYDAFISFSYRDASIVVPELINVIQKEKPSTRLCLHYQDFLVGELIESNIIRAVEYSKGTVIFLSRSYLESEWCMCEFKAAHKQALKDNTHRIIIIKSGDLPKAKEMPEEIQMCLKNTTYLTWEEKRFWKKLLYYLPTSSSPDSTLSM
ncbi:unnamed protein product [Larinioides sclopetarius]|uniref:TIR domain-containing protein n=1 Tax=Larinioides sclopetarius TaxID=280406 RepID=A0AAV2AXI1_9ARAC